MIFRYRFSTASDISDQTVSASSAEIQSPHPEKGADFTYIYYL